jgi:thiol reductant ABC exporter CydC subunit
MSTAPFRLHASRRSTLLAATRLAPAPRGRLAAAVALSALTVLAGCALLATSGALISRAALKPEVLSLLVAIVAVRFFGLARALLRYAERLVSHDLAFRVLRDLRAKTFRRLAPLVPGDLPLKAGDLLSRFVADVDTLQHLYVRALAPPLTAAVTIAAIGIATATQLPTAAIALTAALIAAATLVPLLVAKTARAAARKQAPARAALTQELVEALEGAPELAVAGRATERQQRIAAADAELARTARADAGATALAIGLGTLLAGLGALSVLVAGAAAVHQHTLDGVLLAALVLLALGAFEGVAPLGEAARRTRACGEAAARVAAVVERAPSVADPRTPQLLPPSGALVLRDVSAAYDDGPPVLHGVSLTLEPGERVVLVGPSGAGKTTLARLLVRLADPTAGTVTLGGLDLRDAAQSDVRRAVVLAAQDARVFTTTLRENVKLARRDACDAAIADALAVVGLADWLDALPDGLDTLLGEDGAQVSGGERRRIALARAVLAPARFVILDEPTAQLDPATARETMRRIDAAAGDRALLVITHDPAAVARADRVLTLRDGRLA